MGEKGVGTCDCMGREGDNFFKKRTNQVPTRLKVQKQIALFFEFFFQEEEKKKRKKERL